MLARRPRKVDGAPAPGAADPSLPAAARQLARRFVQHGAPAARRVGVRRRHLARGRVGKGEARGELEQPAAKQRLRVRAAHKAAERAGEHLVAVLRVLPREVEGLDISTYANLRHAFEVIVQSYAAQKEALEVGPCCVLPACAMCC